MKSTEYYKGFPNALEHYQVLPLINIMRWNLMGMSDTNTTTQTAASGGGDEEVERINLRVPNQKYEWLQNELDSFTSDTARFQYLIQFYSDHHDSEDCN